MITDQASALQASRKDVENYLRDNWFGTEVPCLGVFTPYPPTYYLFDEFCGDIKDITTPDGAPLTLPLGFPSPKRFKVKRLWNLILDRGPVSFRIKLNSPKFCVENPFNFYIVPSTISNVNSKFLTSQQYEKFYSSSPDAQGRIDINQFYDLVASADWPKDRNAVGIYEKNSLGTYQISDFRTPSFIELTYPDVEGSGEVIIPLDGPIEGLSLNTYYQFKWRLVYDRNNPRKYKVAVDRYSGYTKINPQEQIEGFFKRRDKADNADDLTPIMRTIINELTASSDGTVIYELLQNANDYPEEIAINEYANVDIEFILTENFLICRHNGKFFTARDIAGVCKVGDGSKSKKKNAIGYKGIGFKTVFRDHDYVYINTGDYHFRFEEAFHRPRKRPWQIMPIWTEYHELDPEIRDIVVSGTERFRVQTVMRPKDKAILRGGQDVRKNYQFLLHDIFRTIRDIIFIPNIQSVTVRISGEDPFVCTKEKADNWAISEPYEYLLTQEEQDEINKEIRTSNEIPPKYEDFEDTKVLFACEKEDKVLKPVENATVNCYLPTQAQFGFPFLMNTDMVPSGDRNELKTNIKVNEKFATIAGSKFAEWLKDLLEEGYEPATVFDLVPDFDNCRQNRGHKYAAFITAFEKGFLETLNSIAVVPVIKENGQKEYITLKEAVYDATGISAKEIMSDADLSSFTGFTGRYFPVLELRECDSFKKLHSLFKDNPLTVSHLLAAFNNESFKTWLTDEDNNCNWLHFILDYREKGSFATCAMFIDEADKTLKTSETLYLDVEKYKDDLGFLHDKLHRLNQKEVDYARIFGDADNLKASFKWASFSPSKFVSLVLLSEENKEETISKLKVKENSIKFIHFLATTEIETPLSTFPIFVDTGCIDKAEGLLYFNGDLAQTARKKSFIKKEWFNVVIDEYLLSDKDKVVAYFKKNGVKDCTFASLYDDIILQESHLEGINTSIASSIDIALDFFEFLRCDKKDLQDKEIKQFYLAAIDSTGKMAYVSPEDECVFFESKDFDIYANKPWAEAGWMYSLYTGYFKNDTDDEDRKSFLKDKFGIKVLNPSTFFKRVIKKHLDDILSKVSAPENEADCDSRKAANYDFISFVCSTASSAFTDDSNPFAGKSYPFVNSQGNITEGPSGFKRFYLYSKEAESVQSLDWLPDDYISVVSNEYVPAENPAVCLSVLGKLGLVEFSPEDFLTKVITANLEESSLKTSLGDKEKNLSFHKYFKDHRSLFSPDAIAGLSKAPVINSNGTLIPSAAGQELINDAVLAILGNTVLSVNFENGGIGLEYQDGTAADNKAYWVEGLGAKQIDSDRLVELLTTGENDFTDDIINVEFWRLVQSLGNSLGKSDIKTILSSIPVKCREAGQDESVIKKLETDTPCYIAKEYFASATHIEDVLKDYSPESFIISPDYLQDEEQETKAAWFKMWEKSGFLSSNDDIILRSILPSLESRKDDITPQLIFENQKLFDRTQPEVLSALSKLNVKTRSGQYLPVTNVLFLGDGLTEPMTFIKLNDEISDEYSTVQCTFFRRIAEDVNSMHRINSNKEWATRKVKQYLGNQETSIHDKFIKEVVILDEKNQLDLDVSFESLLLKNKEENFKLGSELTLGNQYGAEICDFERFGITSLDYISDHYLSLGIKKTTLRDFLSRQAKVHREFQEEDIPLLSDNLSFTVYIWSEYIKTRYSFERMKKFVQDGVLNDVDCVPCENGVYLPSGIYSESLQQYHLFISDADDWFVHKSIPERISFKDGKEEQNPIFSLPLKSELEKNHCFEVLLNSEPDDLCRTSAVARLIALKKEKEVTKEDISEYRGSENALWLNGENEVVRIDGLYGIGRDDKDKYYRRHFQTDSHIIHDELFFDLDYEAACEVLGVQVLHEDDFMVVTPEHYMDETEMVISVLKRKSILLATAIDGAQDLNLTWAESYNKYNEDVESLHFYRCDSIEIECKLNNDICQSDVFTSYFDKDTSSFYYLYGWQDKLVFGGLVEKLCDKDALWIPCDDDYEIVKKIIDENLVGKRLVDFVKKYCAYYSKDPEFQRLFYNEYPSVAEQLGWNVIKERKTESVSYREKVAFGNDEEGPDTRDFIGESTSSVGSTSEPEEDMDPTTGRTNDRIEHPVQQPSTNEAPTSGDRDYAGSGRTEILTGGVRDNAADDAVTTVDLSNEAEESAYPEPGLYDELGEDERIDEEDAVEDPTTSVEEAPIKPKENNADKSREVDEVGDKEPEKQRASSGERSTGSSAKREERPERGHAAGPSQWSRPKQLDNAWVSEGPSIKPIQLEQSDFSDAEYETLADLLNVDREEIADQNYLARKRFWDSLRAQGFETEQDVIDFIKNDYRQNGKASRDIPLHDGRYIHRCSAAKGILYISPSIWNKVKNGSCIICVYAGKRASEFKYFYTQEQILDWVKNTAIFIQVTGQNKGEIMDKFYSGSLESRTGDYYAMIPIKTQGTSDVLFTTSAADLDNASTVID